MKGRGHFSYMYLHSKVGVSGAVASLPCPRTWAAGPEESSPRSRGTAAVTVSPQYGSKGWAAVVVVVLVARSYFHG